MERRKGLRVALLLTLVLAIALFYLLGFHKYFTFSYLKQNHARLLLYVENHPWQSPLVFMGIYILAVTLAFPGASLLTIIGGFLFAQPFATLYVIFSATIGATALFLIAKTSLGQWLEKRFFPTIQKLRHGFNKRPNSYMLFLRLTPLFPFWIINIAPALLGVQLKTFIWTTFVGIIPGTFAYAQAGRGLESLFANPAPPTLSALLNPEVRLALIALSALTLLSILLKTLKEKIEHD